MKTLRLLSFGPGSTCWTAQVAPLYTASQRSCTSASASTCAAHEFVSGIRLREQGARDSVQEARSRVAERSFGSSLREFSELSSTSYGRFGVPGGLMNCQRRLYGRVASKKGKKSEKDVLVKDKEEDVEGEGEVEKVEAKKKKKKSKEISENGDASGMDDGVANVHNLVIEEAQDTELPTESKGKKKLKYKLKDEEIENEQSVSGKGQNGSFSADIQDPEFPTEMKGNKKLKNRIRHEETETEQPEQLDSLIETPKKKKEKKKSKGKKNIEDNSASGVVMLDDAEESENFENVDESASVIEDGLAEELGEHLDDDDFWEDDFEPEAELNDGGDGGGVVLGDAPWAKTAHQLAEEAVAQFNGVLEIFAFKASKDSGIIRVRVDKLSDKYGSPSMDEIQKFSSSYSKLLDKASEAKTIMEDLALEVSSPGAERVVRIPQDLERFKDLPMYVRYMENSSDGSEETPEKDGILELESVDMEVGSAKWKLANVRLNRDLAGKGRGMNRKQRDWRVDLPFENTLLVRLYIDV